MTGDLTKEQHQELVYIREDLEFNIQNYDVIKFPDNNKEKEKIKKGVAAAKKLITDRMLINLLELPTLRKILKNETVFTLVNIDKTLIQNKIEELEIRILENQK